MKFCPRCGESLLDFISFEVKFCRECGVPLNGANVRVDDAQRYPQGRNAERTVGPGVHMASGAANATAPTPQAIVDPSAARGATVPGEATSSPGEATSSDGSPAALQIQVSTSLPAVPPHVGGVAGSPSAEATTHTAPPRQGPPSYQVAAQGNPSQVPASF